MMKGFDMRRVDFKDLEGKVIRRISIDSREVVFICDGGEEFHMFHDQDCCENVSLIDVAGDLLDLIDTPVVRADVSTDEPPPRTPYDDSFTWTFYRITTVKGVVVLRWYGESNGYHSEEVDFYHV